MKICVISDIHGSDRWKEIISQEKNNVDKFIFLGDYMDNKDMDITPREQFENLLEIIETREVYYIDLLIGNIGGIMSV